MKKKYIVSLSAEEKTTCEEVVKKLKGSSQKVIRAQILLKADTNGPNWIDDRIAEAFGCSRRAVEQVRERLVTEGFEIALNGKRPINSPRAKLEIWFTVIFQIKLTDVLEILWRESRLLAKFCF